jgi:hypothetical protein
MQSTSQREYVQVMPLDKIVDWFYRIEAAKLPSPIWIDKKYVFEYKEVTVEIVAFLKTFRAIQSLHSLHLLCEAGLFIDLQTIARCVIECCNQVLLLLEKYPEITPAAQKFVQHFAKTTIDEDFDQKTVGITISEVHKANARMLETASFTLEGNKKLLNNTYKALSTSSHGLFSAIMQMYGGPPGNYKFHVSGIPSKDMKKDQSQLIDVLSISVSHALWCLAIKFNVPDVEAEIRNSVKKGQ